MRVVVQLLGTYYSMCTCEHIKRDKTMIHSRQRSSSSKQAPSKINFIIIVLHSFNVVCALLLANELSKFRLCRRNTQKKDYSKQFNLKMKSFTFIHHIYLVT